jgi:hypothetical protein
MIIRDVANQLGANWQYQHPSEVAFLIIGIIAERLSDRARSEALERSTDASKRRHARTQCAIMITQSGARQSAVGTNFQPLCGACATGVPVRRFSFLSDTFGRGMSFGPQYFGDSDSAGKFKATKAEGSE